MCVTDRHDMSLAVKVVLNPNAVNQSINQSIKSNSSCQRTILPYDWWLDGMNVMDPP